MTRDQIKEIFLRHGFKIHDGMTDLKPYVYEAAESLLADDTALLQQALEALDDCVRWIYALQGTGGIGCLPMQAVKAAAVAAALKERLK